MRRLSLFVIVFGTLSAGCPKRVLIPDPKVPHQVAKESEVEVWCGTPNRKLRRCKVRLMEGWWVASPEVVE